MSGTRAQQFKKLTARKEKQKPYCSNYCAKNFHFTSDARPFLGLRKFFILNFSTQHLQSNKHFITFHWIY